LSAEFVVELNEDLTSRHVAYGNTYGRRVVCRNSGGDQTIWQSPAAVDTERPKRLLPGSP
jgi:hypothetical protein